MILPDDAQAAVNDGAYRFTDADVRGNPFLLAQAVQYLQTYFGDWEPLRKARLMAAATGTLTIPVARMVLNTMRCDAGARIDNVIPMHAVSPFDTPEASREQKLARLAEIEPAQADRLPRWLERQAAEAKRDQVPWVHDDPHWMNQARRHHGSVFTKFTPKMRFAISTFKPTDRRVWHLVDIESCRVEWRNGEIAAYHVTLWCRGRNRPLLFGPDWRPDRFSSFDFAKLPDHRPLCRTCPKIREEHTNR